MSTRKERIAPIGPIPLGLCQCGCGQKTTLAQQSHTRRGWVKGQPHRFIAKHGARVMTRATGELSTSWKGGTSVKRGYLYRKAREHPRACDRGYVADHILIVERALGHVLRFSAEVHHVDRNKSNNANTNLVACHDHAYHFLLHQRQRALDACGDANARPCLYCGRFDRQDEMRGASRIKWHHECEVAKHPRRTSRRRANP